MESSNIVAKNLLEGKTCDNCMGYNDSPYDGAICLWFNTQFPNKRICWDWSSDKNRYGRVNPDIGYNKDNKDKKPHEFYGY